MSYGRHDENFLIMCTKGYDCDFYYFITYELDLQLITWMIAGR